MDVRTKVTLQTRIYHIGRLQMTISANITEKYRIGKVEVQLLPDGSVFIVSLQKEPVCSYSVGGFEEKVYFE